MIGDPAPISAPAWFEFSRCPRGYSTKVCSVCIDDVDVRVAFANGAEGEHSEWGRIIRRIFSQDAEGGGEDKDEGRANPQGSLSSWFDRRPPLSVAAAPIYCNRCTRSCHGESAIEPWTTFDPQSKSFASIASKCSVPECVPFPSAYDRLHSGKSLSVIPNVALS